MPVYKPNEIGGQVLDPKDPADVLDYVIDLAALANGRGNSNWLDVANNEAIASVGTITADDGITVDSSAITDSNTSITVWLSGGTSGTSYGVKVPITTNNSTPRTKTITLLVPVQNR